MKKMGGTKEKFRAKVIEIIGQMLPHERPEIKPEHKMVEDLGADDLALVEIVIAFEEQFEMNIPDGELFGDGETTTETVQDVFDYFDKRVEFES